MPPNFNNSLVWNYVSSAFWRDALQYRLETGRFPGVFRELMDIPIITNDLFYFNFAEPLSEQAQLIADELWTIYRDMFLHQSRLLNQRGHIRPIGEYPDKWDQGYFLFRDQFYRYYPTKVQQLCKDLQLDIIYELYRLLSPIALKNLQENATPALLPYIIDLMIMLMHGGGKFKLIAPPWAFKYYRQAMVEIKKNREMSGNDSTLAIDFRAPNDWLVENRAYQLDTASYHSVDVLAPEDTWEEASQAFFPLLQDQKRLPQWLKTELGIKHWEDLAYSHPCEMVLENIEKMRYKTLSRLHQPLKIAEENTEAPAIFVITPAVYKELINFFYLDTTRFPHVLEIFGRNHYLRLSVFSRIH